jgi:hypothetical protein
MGDLSRMFGSNAFEEGGWGMYPVLVLGTLLVVSGGRYAFDGEPVRLRFIAVLSLTLMVFSVGGTLSAIAKTFWFLEDETRVPLVRYAYVLAEGLKESSRPCVMGLAFLGLGLILVTIGVYRVGRRELSAGRG